MALTRDLFIGGAHVPAVCGRTAEDIEPYTGEVYATVAAAGTEDVARAVEAADAAFAGWAALAPFARRSIFLRAADLLDGRADEVAELMAHEVGATRPWAHFNVMLGAHILREAAAAITAPKGEVLSAQEQGTSASPSANPWASSPRSPPGTPRSSSAYGPWRRRWPPGTRWW